MRIKRLLVGAIGTAMVAASPLALSTTAQAVGADDGVAVATAPEVRTNSIDSAETGLTDPQPATNQRAAAFKSRLKMDKQARSVYKYKQKITIRGQIQASGDGCSASWCYVGLDGDSVTLYRKIAGKKKWKSLGSRPGGSTGIFEFKTPSAGKAVYRLKYSGVGSIPASSTSKKIKGSRNPHAKAFKRGGKIYTKGNVDPGWGKKKIIIQRKTSAKGKWRAYKKVRTARKGAFQARLTSPRTGSWYYRIVVPGSGARWNRGTDGGWRVYRY